MGWQVVYVPFLFAGGTIINQSGVFVYSSTPAAGNLIASIAQTAGVDNFGNPYQAGTTSYVTIAGTTYAIGLNSLSGTGLPGLSMGDIVNVPTAVAGFFGEASSNVSTPQAFAAVTSGQANATDVASFISILSQLQSSVSGGQIVLQAGDVQHDINGSLIDYTSSATGSILATETNGDGNTYHLGHKAYVASAINITSTSFVTVIGVGTLAAGKGYHITGFATYHGNQAAGTANWSFNSSGGLVLGAQQNGYQSFVFSGGGTHVDNGALGQANGPVLTNGGGQVYMWDLYVNVTTSGTLNFTAAEGTAGDSWVVDHIYVQVEEY